MKGALIVFAIFFLALADKKRYDGYQVLRINTNDTTYTQIYDLTEKLNLDVWATNAVEGWMDVMIPERFVSAFKIFDHKVNVEDVQVLLDEHERDRAQAGVGFFDYFPTFEEVVIFLDDTVAANPTVAARVTIGETYLGNEIVGIRLGSTALPLFYIHCTIHAREWITTTSCCYIIEQLLTVDRALLNTVQWVIVPVFNIDGYQYTHDSDRLWRKNRQPNGGGCAGTDINRNYGYQWGGAGSSNQPCSETFRGASAWSTPEASAERAFLQPYLNAGTLLYYMDIHSYGAYFMSSWGYTTTLPPDYPAMRDQMTYSVNAIRAINGRTYTAGSSAGVLYLTSGGTCDYFYGYGGVVQAYTIECFGSNFTPPASFILPIATEVWAGVKAMVV